MGHAWVQGDNSSESMDSRMFGALPLSALTLRTVYRFSNWRVRHSPKPPPLTFFVPLPPGLSTSVNIQTPEVKRGRDLTPILERGLRRTS